MAIHELLKAAETVRGYYRLGGPLLQPNTTLEIKMIEVSSLLELIEWSRIPEVQGDSDGDFQVKEITHSFTEMASHINIPINYVGLTTKLKRYKIFHNQYYLGILLEASDGNDNWDVLYTQQDGVYQVHSSYSYGWNNETEDETYKSLTEFEKVKCLYFKGLHFPE